MMNLTARKCTALRQKLDALDAEFGHWILVSEKDGDLEKHHTQIRALTGHLCGLWSETQAIFDESQQEGTILAEARNVESLVLGLRRIWEFFRSKLVQRRDPSMRPFLCAADELAWDCYRPILDLCAPAGRREPPLVFLNGGLSPYALSRDQTFLAEDVPGQALTGQTYEPILQHLPIPVIGVPWHQVAHLPDLPVVAHETGHTVEQDFGLHDSLLKNLKQALGADSPHFDRWSAWLREVFADIWGCLTLGPAYVGSLIDFMAGDRAVIEQEVATDQSKYPTAFLRAMLCVEALWLMEFVDDAAEFESQWKGEYKAHAMSGFDADLMTVAKAILATPLEHPSLTKPLLEVEGLGFSADDWKWARVGADERAEGKQPESANTIRRWAAASRLLYEQKSEEYAAKRWGDLLIDYANKSLIKRGVRSGESAVGETEAKEIFINARQSGSSWFSTFAEWANVPLPAGRKDKDRPDPAR